MSSNLFTRFKRLLPTTPTRIGTVTAVDGTDLILTEVGGGVVRVAGEATVGQKVYFRGRVMDSLAPTLTEVQVEE